MNILFLCHRIPYPPNKGDKIRSFNEIKYLSKQHNIYLATICDEISDLDYVIHLKEFCSDIYTIFFNKKLKLLRNLFSLRPFSVSSFYDKDLQKYVDKTLDEKSIDIVFCFCSSMAEYIFQNPTFKKNGLSETKLIMDFVDLDSDKWLQYADYSKFPMKLIYLFEHNRLFKYEIKINLSFHHSVFVSSREVKVLNTLYPKAQSVHLIPNGVDLDFFSPSPKANCSPPTVEGTVRDSLSKQNPVLVFTGVMNYFANEDGVKWFCEKIFPKIKTQIPGVQFLIVGNNPTDMIWTLSEIDGVTVTGYVDDIRQYYWMADICVIPLRIARGLQNKVLEAMASKKAIVATSNASDGIICHENEDILIANAEDEFADKTVALLKDEFKKHSLSRKALKNVRENYSWNSNLSSLKNLLSEHSN